jgi:signal transduction histidine kinase
MGPVVPIAALTLLMTGALAWRRRAPLACAVAVIAGLLPLALAWSVPDVTVMPSLALVVACYSSGAHLPLRPAIAGLAVVLVPMGVAVVFFEGQPADLIFLGAIFGGVWVAGRVVRSRRELTLELADRNVLLERDRDEKARVAVAQERTRIARELHDVVAHCVNVMVVQAAAERRSLGAADGGETAAVLASIEDTGREALTEMRRLLGILRREGEHPPLEPPASLRGLESLVEQVRGSGLPVALRVEGEPRSLAPGVDLSAYRIVQEALTNTLKHAGPARAEVRVVHRARELELIVSDDGAGVAGDDGNGPGHGVIGMRERVALFGGSFAAGPRPEGGYRVHARLPLATPADAT